MSAEPDGVYRLGFDMRAEVPALPDNHEIVSNLWLAMMALRQIPQETAA